MRRLAILGLVLLGCSSADGPPRAATREELGALLFDDPRLSEPAGQACSDCHHASAAFADPEDNRTSIGVVPGRFGSRNAPTAMYSGFTPPLQKDAHGDFFGGLQWDGRANTLEEQAALPLLNPLEMNNPDKATVAKKVRAAYGKEMRAIFGKEATTDDERLFAHVTEALGAFQRSAQLAPFSSKYDQYLAGKATLDEREARGLAIFEDPARGNCASCHPSKAGDDGTPPLFTNFTYANIGLPRFNDNPFYELDATLNPDGPNHIDTGLANATGDARHAGMFRVPTLRNVGRTTPYGHNGYFRRLDEMVAFMSPEATRSAPPEIESTSRAHEAAAPLSKQDVVDLVAFLMTLTDVEVLNAPPFVEQ